MNKSDLKQGIIIKRQSDGLSRLVLRENKTNEFYVNMHDQVMILSDEECKKWEIEMAWEKHTPDKSMMVQGRAGGKNIKYEELKRQVGIDRLKQEKQQTFWLREIAIALWALNPQSGMNEKELNESLDTKLTKWLKNQ